MLRVTESLSQSQAGQRGTGIGTRRSYVGSGLRIVQISDVLDTRPIGDEKVMRDE